LGFLRHRVCLIAARLLLRRGIAQTNSVPIRWHSFDQSLLKAYEGDLITEETAIIFCTHKNKMRRDIDTMKKVRGASFTEMPSGLKLQGAFETSEMAHI
jgi:hypothetical protein